MSTKHFQSTVKNFFQKKVKCSECDATGRDKFDGGQCLACHGTTVVEMSIFSIWRENKLREKYNYPRLERIT